MPRFYWIASRSDFNILMLKLFHLSIYKINLKNNLYNIAPANLKQYILNPAKEEI